MLTLSLRRKTLLLLLVGLLAMPWAVSSSPIRQAEWPQAVGAVEPAALDFLSRLWSRFRIIPLSVETKAGCEVDPNGRCLPSPLPSKAGCNVDPNGRCLP